MEVTGLLEDLLGRVGEGVQGLLLAWCAADLAGHLEEDGGGLAVTDLVYCSHKYHLRRLHPLPALVQNLYAPWGVWGRLIHLGVEELARRHWGGVEVEREVARLVDGVAVRGRVDMLRGDTVYEIKSSLSDTGLPREHHVLQLRIYMNLAGARRGVLAYITPGRIVEYTIDEPLGDEELSMLVRETLSDTRHPRWEWECRRCPYATLCPYKLAQPEGRHP